MQGNGTCMLDLSIDAAVCLIRVQPFSRLLRVSPYAPYVPTYPPCFCAAPGGGGVQVYIDVLESVNLLMSSNGAVLRNDVSGKVIMKTLLSGTYYGNLRSPTPRLDNGTHCCPRVVAGPRWV